MKSMKGEVVLNIPAGKAWKMYRDNEIMSKINPDMLAGAECIEGDGSPGSLRLFKLVTFSFLPVDGQEENKCTAGWKAEFEPLSPATPPPEKARDVALGFLKSFEKFELCR